MTLERSGASDGFGGVTLAMLELELAIETIVSRCELAPVCQPAQAVRRGPTWRPRRAY
jgi:cytochrome P450